MGAPRRARLAVRAMRHSFKPVAKMAAGSPPDPESPTPAPPAPFERRPISSRCSQSSRCDSARRERPACVAPSSPPGSPRARHRRGAPFPPSSRCRDGRTPLPSLCLPTGPRRGLLRHRLRAAAVVQPRRVQPSDERLGAAHTPPHTPRTHSRAILNPPLPNKRRPPAQLATVFAGGSALLVGALLASTAAGVILQSALLRAGRELALSPTRRDEFLKKRASAPSNPPPRPQPPRVVWPPVPAAALSPATDVSVASRRAAFSFAPGRGVEWAEEHHSEWEAAAAGAPGPGQPALKPPPQPLGGVDVDHVWRAMTRPPDTPTDSALSPSPPSPVHVTKRPRILIASRAPCCAARVSAVSARSHHLERSFRLVLALFLLSSPAYLTARSAPAHALSAPRHSPPPPLPAPWPA